MVQQGSSLLGKTGSAACPAARGLPAVLCSAAPLPSLCCAAPLHFSVRDLVCPGGGGVVVHLDSRNVRNRVTVLHVLPPTSRVAQIYLAMNSSRGSVCDRCACPDLAYGIIGQGSAACQRINNMAAVKRAGRLWAINYRIRS